jgi:hypothetical protein
MDWTDNLSPCSICNVAIVKPFASFSDYWYFTNGSNFSSGFSSSLPEYRYYLDNGIIYSKPLSTFGSFTFGYAYNVILPIKLLSFDGKLINGSANLDWTIDDAKDLAGFELEYSDDGVSYGHLITLPSNGGTIYAYRHNNLNAGTHYYRLLVKNKNGNTFYSKATLLTTGNDFTVIRGLKPTITQNQTFIEIHSSKQQTVMTVLYDLSGRTLGTFQNILVPGDNNIKINTLFLPRGPYFAHVVTKDGIRANLRFLKK